MNYFYRTAHVERPAGHLTERLAGKTSFRESLVIRSYPVLAEIRELNGLVPIFETTS
jgi:hypothetical protein